MRFAFVSDIHANLQAWNAVLVDIRSNNIDHIICLGDIVGYGPNPAEVLKSIHSNVDHILLGNHDAAVCEKMDSTLFNDHAREMIDWTISNLNKNAIDFLADLPLVLKSSLFRCTHGEFSTPGAYNYIFSAEDTLASLQDTKEPLLFVGHTHEPALYILDNTTHAVEEFAVTDIKIRENERYLINIGSVGQPRDNDARASYCMLDTKTKTIQWRRIPFDIDAYWQALGNINMPNAREHMQWKDPRQNTESLREAMDFSPPTEKTAPIQNTVESVSIHDLQKKAKHWKQLTITILLTAMLSVGIITTLVLHSRLKAKTFTIEHHSTQTGDAGGINIPEWHVHLTNKHRQTAENTDSSLNASALILTSIAQEDSIRLSTHSIKVRKNDKFRITAEFLKSPDFRGYIALSIDLTKTEKQGTSVLKKYITKEPSIKRKNGWMQAKHTFKTPSDTSSITLNICGQFSGKVKIREIGIHRIADHRHRLR